MSMSIPAPATPSCATYQPSAIRRTLDISLPYHNGPESQAPASPHTATPDRALTMDGAGRCLIIVTQLLSD